MKDFQENEIIALTYGGYLSYHKTIQLIDDYLITYPLTSDGHLRAVQCLATDLIESVEDESQECLFYRQLWTKNCQDQSVEVLAEVSQHLVKQKTKNSLPKKLKTYQYPVTFSYLTTYDDFVDRILELGADELVVQVFDFDTFTWEEELLLELEEVKCFGVDYQYLYLPKNQETATDWTRLTNEQDLFTVSVSPSSAAFDLGYLLDQTTD